MLTRPINPLSQVLPLLLGPLRLLQQHETRGARAGQTVRRSFRVMATDEGLAAVAPQHPRLQTGALQRGCTVPVPVRHRQEAFREGHTHRYCYTVQGWWPEVVRSRGGAYFCLLDVTSPY